MDAKICIICGNSFKPANIKQKKCHDCLWHPCVICGKKINRIGHMTCGRECGMIYKSQQCKKKRLDIIGERFCIICGKKYVDIRLNIKTCGNHECIEKAKKINRTRKGKQSICKRCGGQYISYNNCQYCNNCYNNRDCPICGGKIKGGRYETCCRDCAAKLRSQLYGDKYKQLAIEIFSNPITKEKSKKSREARKGIPNIKNRGPKYNRRGKNHPFWKGGTTIGTRRGIQYSTEYKAIINEIYIRDNYTCQICGKRGQTLNVHHIRTRDYYPELRFDKYNLVTLCENCHKKVHKMCGGTNGRKETFSILFKLSNGL